MRLIAGKWRSRLLETPAGLATRPTADRARETLFSMLLSRLGSFEGLTVLDLYAGSGALALEALSRGAAQAFLVERAPAARMSCQTAETSGRPRRSASRAAASCRGTISRGGSSARR